MSFAIPLKRLYETKTASRLHVRRISDAPPKPRTK